MRFSDVLAALIQHRGHEGHRGQIDGAPRISRSIKQKTVLGSSRDRGVDVRPDAAAAMTLEDRVDDGRRAFASTHKSFLCPAQPGPTDSAPFAPPSKRSNPVARSSLRTVNGSRAPSPRENASTDPAGFIRVEMTVVRSARTCTIRWP